MKTKKRDFPPIHPGEILVSEFLEPLGISQYRLAKDIGVTPRRINEIVHGRRSISADTALRLSHFFGMEAQFWLNLQARYDMEVTKEELHDKIVKEVRPFTRAALLRTRADMKQIDITALDDLTRKAKAAPRKRANFNLHPELSDPVQRLCIAMEPDTYVRPHRHSDPESWEMLIILRGSLALTFFDEKGMVIDRRVLDARGPVTAVEFQQNTWHAPASLEPGTVVFEVKKGPYKPVAEHNSVLWAPSEDRPEAARFLQWYKSAVVGDVPPTS
jgi:addiction module HigA family antidote